MSEIQLGAVEARFADIIWQNEPMNSGELFKLAEQELTWKRQTSYTVLKRLCERGIFKQEGRTITACISREEFYAMQSEQFVEETFDGSLPAFLAAFVNGKKFSRKEIEELQKVIEQMKEE